MDAAYLENLVRFTGVLVALVASFLAAPEATRHRWTWLRTHAVTTSQTVAAQGRATAAQAKRALRRLLGRKPPPRIVPVGQAVEHVTIHPAAIVTSTHVFPVNPALPLAERVERLEQHIQVLNKLHDANKEAIAREKAALVAMLRDLEQRVERDAAAIRSEIAAMEQTALLVDARAVPVIGFGIVLTSLPDLIASSTTWTGLLIAAALVALLGAWAHFWTSGPAGGGS